MTIERKVDPLPPSSDEYWDGEKIKGQRVRIPICQAHLTKEGWKDHEDFVDNGDGTVGCRLCSYGARLPGYQRVLDGRIVDLRVLNAHEGDDLSSGVR